MPERYVTNQHVALWTVAEGAGVPLLLCSGGPGYPDYMEPVAGMVADRARVIRWEQRGCGRSGGEPPYTLADCLGDMEAIRAAYAIERWIIGGHSWGADLALLYTLAYPDRALGLICLAGGRIHTDEAWRAEFHRRAAATTEPLPETAYPVNTEVYQQLIADWQLATQRPTLLRELAQLDVPALFLYGDRDLRPGWPEMQIAALLPHGEARMIADAPHMLWFTHPDVVADALRDFVTRVAGKREM